MNLFIILKEVEKLGYIILTYEEAREELGIMPEEVANYCVSLLINNKKYFVFKNTSEEVKENIIEFLKNNKLKKIKNTLYSILENNYILEQKRSL